MVRVFNRSRMMCFIPAPSAPCAFLPGWPSHTASRRAFGRVESGPSAVVCLTGGMMFVGARCTSLPFTGPRSRRDESSGPGCLRAGGNLDGDDEIHAALRVFLLAAVAAALGAVIFAGAGDALPA